MNDCDTINSIEIIFKKGVCPKLRQSALLTLHSSQLRAPSFVTDDNNNMTRFCTAGCRARIVPTMCAYPAMGRGVPSGRLRLWIAFRQFNGMRRSHLMPLIDRYLLVTVFS